MQTFISIQQTTWWVWEHAFNKQHGEHVSMHPTKSMTRVSMHSNMMSTSTGSANSMAHGKHQHAFSKTWACIQQKHDNHEHAFIQQSAWQGWACIQQTAWEAWTCMHSANNITSMSRRSITPQTPHTHLHQNGSDLPSSRARLAPETAGTHARILRWAWLILTWTEPV